MKRIKKLPEYRYRFIEEFSKGCLTIQKGVALKGDIVVKEDCVSVVGNELFSDIPMKYLEKFEVQKLKPQSRKKKEAPVKPSGDARVSNKKELLRKSEGES